MAAPAFAYADEVPNVPVWAQDDGQNSSALSAQAELPETYDLRDNGLVTPVKLQNPFQSCWAFGAIAATESSLLSAYGSTYRDSKLDLSERHLAYFALHPVTAKINPNQAGEGVSTFDTSPNAALGAGGAPIFVTSLFSQGVGPISEEVFPYRGKDAMLALDYINAHPEEAVMTQLIRELGSEEAAEQFIARKMAGPLKGRGRK